MIRKMFRPLLASIFHISYSLVISLKHLFHHVFIGHYARFSGRSTIRAFWFAFVFLGILNVLLRYSVINGSVSELVAYGFFVVTVVPFCAVVVRRLHDIGFNGWWFFGYIFLQTVSMAYAWHVLSDFYNDLSWVTWLWLTGLGVLFSLGLISEWFFLKNIMGTACMESPWLFLVLSFATALAFLFLLVLSMPSLKETNRFGEKPQLK